MPRRLRAPVRTPHACQTAQCARVTPHIRPRQRLLCPTPCIISQFCVRAPCAGPAADTDSTPFAKMEPVFSATDDNTRPPDAEEVRAHHLRHASTRPHCSHHTSASPHRPCHASARTSQSAHHQPRQVRAYFPGTLAGIVDEPEDGGACPAPRHLRCAAARRGRDDRTAQHRGALMH